MSLISGYSCTRSTTCAPQHNPIPPPSPVTFKLYSLYSCVQMLAIHNGSMRSPSSSMRFVGFVCLTTICQFNCLSVWLHLLLPLPPVLWTPRLSVPATLFAFDIFNLHDIARQDASWLRSWPATWHMCKELGYPAATRSHSHLSSLITAPRNQAELALIRLIKQQKVASHHLKTRKLNPSPWTQNFLSLIVVHPAHPEAGLGHPPPHSCA